MLSSVFDLLKSFNNCFGEFDIFKNHINLLINDKAKTTTCFGKIFSLISLIYVLISFYNSDLMQKTNPNILIQDIKLNERIPLKISKKDLSLAVGLSNSDKEYEYDEKIFEISAFVFYQDIRNKSKTIRNFKMHLCQESDFEDQNLFGRLNLNGFVKIYLILISYFIFIFIFDRTLCLPEEIFELKGFWDEVQIQYLKVEISVCRNNSENDASCYSDEVIKDYFTKNERMLVFYANDINIDASSSKDQPFTNKLNSFYFSMDINLEKSYEIYLKQTDISTTDGLFLQDTRTFSTIQLDKIKSDINTKRANANLIGCLFFFTSDLNSNIARKYQDLQEAFGTMSGIFNLLMLVGMMFANFENNFRITRDLASKLYVFQNLDRFKKNGKIHAKNDNVNFEKNSYQFRKAKNKIPNDVLPSYLLEEKTEKEKNEIKFVNSKVNEIDEKKEEEEIKNSIGSRKDQDVNSKTKSSQIFSKIKKVTSVEKEKNLENFEKFKNGKEKFNFGFIQYLRMKLRFNKKHLKNEEKLFTKSQQQISFEMDIIQILKKIQEIEKLKKILLNENEQYLFDLLDKPYIHLEKHDIRGETEGIDFRRKSILVNSIKNIDFKKEHIIENYRKVKNSKSVVGNRLLKLMDQDVFMFVGNEHFEDAQHQNVTE